VEEAVRRRLFSRAFKAEAKAPATLVADIEAALRTDVRQALSFANKAGDVLTGFGKVESAIAEKPIVALIHATEAAEDGRRKLTNGLRKRFGDAISGFPVITDLSNDELGLALGRSHVIHAALVAGAGSDGFLTRWHRYRSYRGIDADQAGPAGGTGDPDDLKIEPAGI
jgi:ribosomal protein L30E